MQDGLLYKNLSSLMPEEDKQLILVLDFRQYLVQKLSTQVSMPLLLLVQKETDNH